MLDQQTPTPYRENSEPSPETSRESQLAAQVAELKVENERLRRTINIDAKTGLLTETGMREQVAALQTLLEKPADEWYWREYSSDRSQEREDKPVSQLEVVMFDLDKFKTLNDTLGHGPGDEALGSFAVFLQNTFRDSDIIARSSSAGDEFIVLAPIPEAEDGYAEDTIKEKLLASIEDLKHFPGDKPAWADLLGSSYGIAKLDLTRNMDLGAAVTNALAEADENLRHNKGDKAR